MQLNPYLVKSRFTTQDIIGTLERDYRNYHRPRLIDDLIQKLKLKGLSLDRAALKVYRFIRKNIRNVDEPLRYQVLQQPHALLTTRKGNCKSYVFLAGQIFKRLGFGTAFKYTNNRSRSNNFHHVVLEVTDGRQKFIIDGTHRKFNVEFPYIHSKVTSMDPGLYVLKGQQRRQRSGPANKSKAQQRILKRPAGTSKRSCVAAMMKCQAAKNPRFMKRVKAMRPQRS